MNETATSRPPPKVTIAVLSWNRLLYLRATLESARLCIDYPNLEWIVSDNESTEPGLRDYLESLTWLDRRIYRRQSHADAMNELVARATGEMILIWPEDVQFVVKGTWMADMVEILQEHRDIGTMCLDFMRKATLRDVFHPVPWRHPRRFLDEIWRYGIRFRRSRSYASSRGVRVVTLGWTRSGVCGSGIPTLARTELWRQFGPWRTRGTREQVGLVDSSLGAEEDMVQRFYRSRVPLQGAIPLVPVAADIITDPTGCKAKVRGKCRYGVYTPPPEGVFYYRIRDMSEMCGPSDGVPVNFTDGVQPIGYEIPLDKDGDRLKSSINTSVVFDIETGRPADRGLQGGRQTP